MTGEFAPCDCEGADLLHPHHGTWLGGRPRSAASERERLMSGVSSQLVSTNSAADAAGASGGDHGRRLSPLDGSFLRLGAPQSPTPVGVRGVFAGPPGAP